MSQPLRIACLPLAFALAACSGGSSGDDDTGSDADSDGDSDSDTDADTDADTDGDTDADADADTDADTDTDTDTDADADADTDSDADADTDGDADTDADTDTDTDTDSDTDADSDADADTDADTDSDSDSDVACVNDGPCTGLGLVCNENWGICVAGDCTGEDDFTPCEVVTADPTDRSYDICVEESCVSPGCGDGTCNAPGPHFPLADTGQRTCYDEWTTMTCTTFPCNSDGSPDFCGQDAQYGWDAVPGNDPEDRFTRDLSVPGEPVVTDNVTGLIWQGCAVGLSGDACTGGSATQTVWATQLANCDSLDWGGHTDWRLPDEYELQSLVDYGKASGPMIDAAAFPATPNSYFWSSSSRAASTSHAWLVRFMIGAVEFDDNTSNYFARCVRGGPSPRPPRFTRDTSTANQPTVLDNRTGLEWQGCARGLTGDTCGTGSTTILPWQAALDYCEELSWGGDTDWRLPDIDELKSIVDNRRTTAPFIDATAFPATPNSLSYFWSSSSEAASMVYAWGVVFFDGYVGKDVKAYSFYARCVR